MPVKLGRRRVAQRALGQMHSVGAAQRGRERLGGRKQAEDGGQQTAGQQREVQRAEGQAAAGGGTGGGRRIIGTTCIKLVECCDDSVKRFAHAAIEEHLKKCLVEFTEERVWDSVRGLEAAWRGENLNLASARHDQRARSGRESGWKMQLGVEEAAAQGERAQEFESESAGARMERKKPARDAKGSRWEGERQIAQRVGSSLRHGVTVKVARVNQEVWTQGGDPEKVRWKNLPSRWAPMRKYRMYLSSIRKTGLASGICEYERNRKTRGSVTRKLGAREEAVHWRHAHGGALGSLVADAMVVWGKGRNNAPDNSMVDLEIFLVPFKVCTTGTTDKFGPQIEVVSEKDNTSNNQVQSNQINIVTIKLISYQINILSKFCDRLEYHLTTAIKLRCYQINMLPKDLAEFQATQYLCTTWYLGTTTTGLSTIIPQLPGIEKTWQNSGPPNTAVPHTIIPQLPGTEKTWQNSGPPNTAVPHTIIPQLPGTEKTWQNSGPPNTAVPHCQELKRLSRIPGHPIPLYHKFQATQYRCTTVITSGIWVPQLPEIGPVSTTVPQILQVVFQYHNYWKLKDLAKFMALNTAVPQILLVVVYNHSCLKINNLAEFMALNTAVPQILPVVVYYHS
ncbi:hypothetical protein GGX14DRAFT_391526 [Mycena pura]|uniref:Uncharacterized protein n=1 Tax=Mycena pura TaxID=153505 RepID=A0AAD6VM42_9AGAR|nr:hypothetical protein GGX14DRAFT_391526 [Mycena pura]